MNPLVGVIMGSRSDWSTMSRASEILEQLAIPYETRIVSAHRTPDLLFEYCAAARERGIEVIIAGAGGAAHLPGMAAAKTILPVLGVPVKSRALNGIDSLLSIAQSNVSSSLKELQSWRLISKVPSIGQKRDFYTTSKDVWKIFSVVAEERKKREMDPTLTVLRD